jgi:hypothetical protein
MPRSSTAQTFVAAIQVRHNLVLQALTAVRAVTQIAEQRVDHAMHQNPAGYEFR